MRSLGSATTRPSPPHSSYIAWSNGSSVGSIGTVRVPASVLGAFEAPDRRLYAWLTLIVACSRSTSSQRSSRSSPSRRYVYAATAALRRQDNGTASHETSASTSFGKRNCLPFLVPRSGAFTPRAGLSRRARRSRRFVLTMSSHILVNVPHTLRAVFQLSVPAAIFASSESRTFSTSSRPNVATSSAPTIGSTWSRRRERSSRIELTFASLDLSQRSAYFVTVSPEAEDATVDAGASFAAASASAKTSRCASASRRRLRSSSSNFSCRCCSAASCEAWMHSPTHSPQTSHMRAPVPFTGGSYVRTGPLRSVPVRFALAPLALGRRATTLLGVRVWGTFSTASSYRNAAGANLCRVGRPRRFGGSDHQG